MYEWYSYTEAQINWVFLAIAVDNLGDAEDMDNEDIEKEKEGADDAEAGNPDLDEEKGETDDEYLNEEEGYSSEGSDHEYDETGSEEMDEQEQEERDNLDDVLVNKDTKQQNGDIKKQDEEPKKRRQPSLVARPRRLSEIEIKAQEKPIPEASSFFIFSKDNCFRVFCYKVQNNSWFKNFILICILVSSLTLAMEDPVGNPASEYKTETLTMKVTSNTGTQGLWTTCCIALRFHNNNLLFVTKMQKAGFTITFNKI